MGINKIKNEYAVLYYSKYSQTPLTDLKGLTIFFCYWWTSVIAKT